MSDQDECGPEGAMGGDSENDSCQPSSEHHSMVMNKCGKIHVGTNTTQIINIQTCTIIAEGEKRKGKKAQKKKYTEHGLRSALKPSETSASPVVSSNAVQQTSATTHRKRINGASSTSSRTSSPFSGKTLRDVFGPFMDVKALDSHVLHVRHEVKLFGKVLEIFCPRMPNEMNAEKKRKLGVRCRTEKFLKIKLEMEAEDGEKIVFPLIAFHDAVPEFKATFKRAQRYIVCGVSIEYVPEPFKSTEGEIQGILDRTFVHQLSPQATLDSLADDEIRIDGCESGRIPLIMLPNFMDWLPCNYIQGKIKKRWEKNDKCFIITIGDETGVANIVAHGIPAQYFSRPGKIKVHKTYRVEKGNGVIVEADGYISASCPVQLNVGQNTRILPVD